MNKFCHILNGYVNENEEMCMLCERCYPYGKKEWDEIYEKFLIMKGKEVVSKDQYRKWYYMKNKEKLREYSKKYKVKNPNKQREYQKKYRKNKLRKLKHNLYMKDWHKLQKLKICEKYRIGEINP